MPENKDGNMTAVPEASGKIAEVIKLIAKTEEDSEHKQSLAENEARLIVTQAQQDGKKTADEQAETTREKVERIRDLTEVKSREIAVNMLTQINNDCEDLKNAARSHKEQAVAAAVERIINEWR